MYVCTYIVTHRIRRPRTTINGLSTDLPPAGFLKRKEKFALPHYLLPPRTIRVGQICISNKNKPFSLLFRFVDAKGRAGINCAVALSGRDNNII